MVCIIVLVVVGLVSYKVNSSYAIFSYEVVSEKVLELEVCNNAVNSPVLSENMIPVYYDEDSEVWRKADSGKVNWYNYCDKEWANSVTVSSENRSAYLSAIPGTEIDMDDILTMQVWIPRYTYTVWNYNLSGTVKSSPQEIKVEFEKGVSSSGEIECIDNVQGTSDGTASGTQPTVSEICKLKSTGAECTDGICNGKKYTHPAFTFGDEELTGFWVGKFEVSSDIECTAINNSVVGSGCNLTIIKPLVKPNVNSWRGAMIGTYENNMMMMNDDENIYGFVLTDDIHMIKNMEWGAVAYLSHSKYGINGEVNINSNSNYITGCGPQSEDSVEAGTVCNSYETELGQSASSTGNIYGIYDMNGGVREYTMGNIISPDGKIMMSGYRGSYNAYSGYTGIVYYENSSGDYTLYTGYYGNYPADKYYDKYSFNTGTSMRRKSKLGDGIREVYNNSTYGWYDDSLKFIYNTDPWFNRGGYYGYGSDAGVFRISSGKGSSYDDFGSRLAISQ